MTDPRFRDRSPAAKYDRDEQCTKHQATLRLFVHTIPYSAPGAHFMGYMSGTFNEKQYGRVDTAIEVEAQIWTWTHFARR